MLACSCVREALSSPLSSKLECVFWASILWGLAWLAWLMSTSYRSWLEEILACVESCSVPVLALHCTLGIENLACFVGGNVSLLFLLCLTDMCRVILSVAAWSRVAVIIDGENTYTGFFIFSSGNWWGEKPGHSAKLLCFRDFGMDSLYSCYIPAAVVLSRKHAGIIYCAEKLVNSCRSKLG